MASPYGPPPWNDAEKNYLLCEIIKQAGPQPTHLFNILSHLNINVANIRWSDLPLPLGRSLNESLQAFDSLRRSGGSSTMGVLTGLGASTPSPLPTSSNMNLKRNYPFAETYTGREIRPKPSVTTGAYGQPTQIEQPPKKKRGRPTKAEAAARAEAHSAAGEPSTIRRAVSLGGAYPPPPVAPAPAEPTDAPPPPTTCTSPQGETRPNLPPVSRMPISSILTPTAPTATSQSSSSSGKRRRGRSTRSEPEDMPTAGTLSAVPPPNFGQSQEYESPYARLETEDTPARAAVMRHRNDHPPPYNPPHTSASDPPRSL